MNLLAFDLGKRIGVAALRNDNIKTKFLDIENEFKFMEYVGACIDYYQPAAVLYENAAFQQGMAAQFWHSQRGILAAICQKHGVLYHGVGASTIKKHITGCGRCPKPKRKGDPEYGIFPALRARGYNITDHNEADALALLLYAIDTGLVEVDK
jgi:Holliday junction resolvasome RuvABC endonuclease subunit